MFDKLLTQIVNDVDSFIGEVFRCILPKELTEPAAPIVRNNHGTPISNNVNIVSANKNNESNLNENNDNESNDDENNDQENNDQESNDNENNLSENNLNDNSHNKNNFDEYNFNEIEDSESCNNTSNSSNTNNDDGNANNKALTDIEIDNLSNCPIVRQCQKFRNEYVLH
ncbi:hypothetical protein BGZ58_002800 [Dissophora ornata]|nr:hypothetical protein BGZ58_002800 [Dissophora ornata]